MLWNKNKEQENTQTAVAKKPMKQLLAPFHEVGRFAIEQKDKLQAEESVTIEGIETIEDSFDLVQKKYGNIIVSVDSFQHEFESIREVTDHFESIIKTLTNTGSKAAATDAYPAGATEWTGLVNHEVTEIKYNKLLGTVTFLYRGGTPQGIEDVEDGKAAQKILRDGKVIIIRGGVEYDLNGKKL